MSEGLIGATVDEWRALVAGSKTVKPYVAGDMVSRYCGKACREVVSTVGPLNHNNPDRLAAYCQTRGCSCSMRVSDLPVRYVVDQWELAAGAKRLLDRLSVGVGVTS